MEKQPKKNNHSSNMRPKKKFTPKPRLLNGFIPKYVIKTILHNLKRSSTIVIAIIISVSLTTALIMWIETYPRLAINSAMKERSFEIRVQNLVYGLHPNDRLEEVQGYLEDSEPLVETSYLVQPTIFLFNLNDQDENFTVYEPPVNQSSFYVSEILGQAAYLIEEEYISHISPQLILSSPQDNLTLTNGVVISKRMLHQIELATNQTYKAGDKIDFAVATRVMDPESGEFSVRFFNPIKFYNVTINAIFDRKVQRNLLYPYFFPESLGDGIFISRNLFNRTSIKNMEYRVIGPRLYVRLSREAIASMSIFSVTQEIEALAFRISITNTIIIAEVFLDEINQILTNYENSQVLVFFIFVPLIIVASVFFVTTTSHFLEKRESEIELLRLKGSPFKLILALFIIEFIILSIIGTSIGIIVGLIITLIISSTENFLVVNPQNFPTDFINIAFLSWPTWVFSALFIGFTYILIAIQKTRKVLIDLQEQQPKKENFNISKQLTQRNFDLIVLVLIVFIFLLILQSDIINRLTLDPQLMGFYLAGATIIWFLLCRRLTSFSGESLPRISKITHYLFKSKSKVITMNLVRKRPQVLNIITLVVLTVSLGIFSTYYAQTIDYNTQKNLNYLVGSDFKVFTEETSLNYSLELEKIEGVSAVSAISQTSNPQVSVGSYSVTLAAIDPKNYLSACSFSKESIIAGGSAEDILSELEINNASGMIINDFLASTLKLNIGDPLNVSGLFGSHSSVWNFTVAGIMNSAPGIGKLHSEAYTIRGFTKFGGIVLVNQDLMKSFRVTTTRIFLVKVDNPSAETLNSITSSLNKQPQVIQVINQQHSSELFFNFMKITGVAGILTVNFLMSLFIAIIGISLFYNFIISKRLKEYAILRACGGTKRQVLWISFAEALIIIFFGITLGFIIGSGFTIGFMVASRSYVLSTENVFRLEFTASPLLIGLILVLEFCILFLASSLAANKVQNVNVSNLLRNL
ncbi:MAG: FtsX-like permease family protein [Candidatus Heimdallarchaeota archaeon]|nr:MAG: FtsX-like permease family protein [Candidatus Heimdallarchaeota archaeon]